MEIREEILEMAKNGDKRRDFRNGKESKKGK